MHPCVTRVSFQPDRSMLHAAPNLRMLHCRYDPFAKPEVAAAHGVRLVSLDELLRTADFGPSSPTNRAPVCAARTLNTAGQSRATLSLR